MLTKNDLEINLTRTHDWIKSADQKVGIFLAFQGVILTLLFLKIFLWIMKNWETFGYDAFFIISGIILMVCSIFKSVSAIIPRLNKGKGKEKNKKSMVYFGDIAKLEFENFKKNIDKASAGDYRSELVEQIYVCSKIAWRKHVQFRDSIFLFFCGMILLALSFLFFNII